MFCKNIYIFGIFFVKLCFQLFMSLSVWYLTNLTNLSEISGQVCVLFMKFLVDIVWLFTPNSKVGIGLGTLTCICFAAKVTDCVT